MEEFRPIIEIIELVINVIGVAILLLGFLKLLYKYLKVELKDFHGVPITSFQRIRYELAIYILLALDFMIASDIIASLVATSPLELMDLGINVVLRIAIGYFLGKELEEVKDL